MQWRKSTTDLQMYGLAAWVSCIVYIVYIPISEPLCHILCLSLSLQSFILCVRGKEIKASKSCIGPTYCSLYTLWPVTLQAVGQVKDQCKYSAGNDSLALNHTLTLEGLPGWENSCYSRVPSSKLPTFSHLSNTKNAINCEMDAGSPTGSLEMIGPF